MDDLLTCSVCCEPYQEKMRHPVLLPRCGHSFCRPCVSFLVMNGCVVCPSCRMDQRVETADHLPTEFSLLAIKNVQQVTKMELCEPHGVKLSFWCKSCGRAACGECLFEDHPTHSHSVVKATRFFEETKEAVNDIASKFMDALEFREKWYFQQVFQTVKSINDAIRTISVLRRDLDDARELFKGVKVVEGFGPTTALSEASKCLGLKWNLQNCQLVFRSPGGGGKKEEEAAEEKEKDETETKEKETNEAKEKDADEAKEEEKEEKKEDNNSPETADEKEKCNGEKEKEEASEKEKEKDIDEEETLTEEEKRKRRKIIRLKEKLAAAAAAAEKEQQESKKEKVDLKKGDKEKISEVKRKASLDKDSAPSLAELKTKNLARKYVPLPREPSMSPEREATTTQTQTEKDNKEADTDAASSREKEAELGEKSETGDKKDEELQNKAKTETSEANKTTETETPPTTPGVNSKNEAKLKNKLQPSASSSAIGSKRPRGRLARQALKRSQTMNFSSQTNDEDNTQDPDNIKGLDLETNRTSKNEEPTVDNKDIEAQASGEVKEESNNKKEETDEKEERWPGKEEQGSSKEKNKKPDGYFEMEPEEKERITTELMEVPSLTMVVEGIGGRQAYMAWEKEGLHVYCHQYQDLPYDVLIKSTVLHALIPTKSPTVFLDVGTEHKVLGRVYISLWGHLRRAANFLHLCLGDRGPSFRNTMFLEVLNADCPGERIRGGDYEQNNGRGGESLVDDLEFQEGYSMPMEAGMVTAGGPNRRESDSQFFVCTEDDHDRKFACPFGRVTSGLCFMKEAVWLVVTKEMWIRECGIVLDAPRI